MLLNLDTLIKEVLSYHNYLSNNLKDKFEVAITKEIST